VSRNRSSKPLLNTHLPFPYTCLKPGVKDVACAIRYGVATGMFLELRFPLEHIPCALRTFIIPYLLFIAEIRDSTPLHPPALHPSTLCPTMPRVSSSDSSTISRHQAVTKQAPKLTTNKTLTFWQRRTQTRRAKRILTAGDHLLRTKKQEQDRLEYLDALEEGHAVIRGLAEGLRNRFGKYSVDHYLNDLMHRAHTSRSVRKVSGWNAYQKFELERMKSKPPTIYL
jgi:hypothetical protein